MADPYTDPESGVLVNRLGLATQPELERVERDLTSFALLSWTARGVPRPLAIACLSRIARHRSGLESLGKKRSWNVPGSPAPMGMRLNGPNGSAGTGNRTPPSVAGGC
jgi:hypothetical protein